MYEDSKSKVEMIYAVLARMCEDLGIKSAVISIEPEEGLHAASWWPGCGSDCKTPHKCASRVFRSAAEDLVDRSKDIDEGDPGLEAHRMNPDTTLN